ncbi:MAG TPA: outer membrane beta-barrel protein, partial [Polyangiaceae bacterium]
MRGGYRIAGFAAVFASVLSFALPAAAQSTPSAIGVPLGGFRLFPTLEVGANYDDNVFRTQAG